MSKDDIINFYEKLPLEFRNNTKDKTYKKHLIKPRSMIAIVGGTGQGKTNSVVNFLNRKNSSFYEIIIFCGSGNSDEPLYSFLKSRIEGIKIVDDPSLLPKIENYKDEDKKTEKLIIFDDAVLSDKKVLKEIAKFFMASRV